MCNAKPRRCDGHATPNRTGVTRGDAKAGEQLRELQGRGWAPNMVSLLFLKYDYSTAGCRLSGEGFRLSIAFMSIFDAKGVCLANRSLIHPPETSPIFDIPPDTIPY